MGQRQIRDKGPLQAQGYQMTRVVEKCQKFIDSLASVQVDGIDIPVWIGVHHRSPF